ncbi:MAG: hypothetical protein AB1758_24080, partial [Candidatus Eremiobacterota bacterium]
MDSVRPSRAGLIRGTLATAALVLTVPSLALANQGGSAASLTALAAIPGPVKWLALGAAGL